MDKSIAEDARKVIPNSYEDLDPSDLEIKIEEDEEKNEEDVEKKKENKEVGVRG